MTEAATIQTSGVSATAAPDDERGVDGDRGEELLHASLPFWSRNWTAVRPSTTRKSTNAIAAA